MQHFLQQERQENNTENLSLRGLTSKGILNIYKGKKNDALSKEAQNTQEGSALFGCTCNTTNERVASRSSFKDWENKCMKLEAAFLQKLRVHSYNFLAYRRMKASNYLFLEQTPCN